MKPHPIPHPRIRKTIKWGGAVVTVLLMVVWVQSGWRMNLWNKGRNSVMIWHGSVTVVSTSDATAKLWTWTSLATMDPVVLFDAHASCKNYYGQWIVETPIWPIPIAVGIAAIVAWRLDTLARRRERVGRCPKCNYDRAGLAAGAKCPECGADAAT